MKNILLTTALLAMAALRGGAPEPHADDRADPPRFRPALSAPPSCGRGRGRGKYRGRSWTVYGEVQAADDRRTLLATNLGRKRRFRLMRRLARFEAAS